MMNQVSKQGKNGRNVQYFNDLDAVYRLNLKPAYDEYLKEYQQPEVPQISFDDHFLTQFYGLENSHFKIINVFMWS